MVWGLQMEYKDEKGNVLYGFSQESLEKTNKELRKTNRFILIMVILFILFLVVFISFLAWLEINDIISILVYK